MVISDSDGCGQKCNKPPRGNTTTNTPGGSNTPANQATSADDTTGNAGGNGGGTPESSVSPWSEVDFPLKEIWGGAFLKPALYTGCYRGWCASVRTYTLYPVAIDELTRALHEQSAGLGGEIIEGVFFDQMVDTSVGEIAEPFSRYGLPVSPIIHAPELAARKTADALFDVVTNAREHNDINRAYAAPVVILEIEGFHYSGSHMGGYSFYQQSQNIYFAIAADGSASPGVIVTTYFGQARSVDATITQAVRNGNLLSP